jgi:hypothetical protein
MPQLDSNPQSQQDDQSHSIINASNLSTVILVVQLVGAGIKRLVVAAEDKN